MSWSKKRFGTHTSEDGLVRPCYAQSLDSCPFSSYNKETGEEIGHTVSDSRLNSEHLDSIIRADLRASPGFDSPTAVVVGKLPNGQFVERCSEIVHRVGTATGARFDWYAAGSKLSGKAARHASSQFKKLESTIPPPGNPELESKIKGFLETINDGEHTALGQPTDVKNTTVKDFYASLSDDDESTAMRAGRMSEYPLSKKETNFMKRLAAYRGETVEESSAAFVKWYDQDLPSKEKIPDSRKLGVMIVGSAFYNRPAGDNGRKKTIEYYDRQLQKL
jgi:hypothetical protein